MEESRRRSAEDPRPEAAIKRWKHLPTERHKPDVGKERAAEDAKKTSHMDEVKKEKSHGEKQSLHDLKEDKVKEESKHKGPAPKTPQRERRVSETQGEKPMFER